jgi:hypothetical protein
MINAIRSAPEGVERDRNATGRRGGEVERQLDQLASTVGLS